MTSVVASVIISCLMATKLQRMQCMSYRTLVYELVAPVLNWDMISGNVPLDQVVTIVFSVK